MNCPFADPFCINRTTRPRPDSLKILSCAEKRETPKVVCKILCQVEGSRDPQSSAQLDLESAWLRSYPLEKLFDDGEFIEHVFKKHSLSSKFEDIKKASFSRTKSHDLL